MHANSVIDLLDVVALTADLPKHQLRAGEVGTVVEQLDENVFEVEFSDDNGRAYALAPVESSQILRLIFEEQAR